MAHELCKMPCCCPCWGALVARDSILSPPPHAGAGTACPQSPGLLNVSSCLPSTWQQTATGVFVFLPVQCCRADFWGNKQVPGQNLIGSAGIWCPNQLWSWGVVILAGGSWALTLWESGAWVTSGWQGHPAHAARQKRLICTWYFRWCQRWQPRPTGEHHREMLLIIFFFGYAPNLWMASCGD